MPPTLEEIFADYQKSMLEANQMMPLLLEECIYHYNCTQENSDLAHQQIHCRAYIRAVFGFIEGTVHRTKLATLHLARLFLQHPERQKNFSGAEFLALENNQSKLDKDGNVVPEERFYPFDSNFKFVFRMYAKIVSSPFKLNLGGRGWGNLKQAIKVRDRLMHPKELSDIEVSPKEVEATKDALEWFLLNYHLSHCHFIKAFDLISVPVEKDNELDSSIEKLEKELRDRGN